MNTKKTYNGTYDSSWDEDNEELYDEKYSAWDERDLELWLNEKLTFPFDVKREEDEEGSSWKKSKKFFGIGHVMEVRSIEGDDDKYGVIIKVYENGKTGYIPLCDVEVSSRANPNFWPVRAPSIGLVVGNIEALSRFM